MNFHPYSEIFPLLDGAALAELIQDIKTHGLREPIITYRGAILDGRNRFIACQKANVKPTFTVYAGSEEQALAWVVSANIHRRHLTVEQRAMAAARIATLQNGANQHSSGKIGSNGEGASRDAPSQATAAERLGVSRSSVQRAKKVVEKGSKPLQRAVESGDVPLRKAAAVADLPKAEQLAAAMAESAEKPSDPELPTAEDEANALERADQDWRERLDRILTADDKLAAMSAELKRATQEMDALKQARDRYMNECVALRKQLAARERELKRLRKAA